MPRIVISASRRTDIPAFYMPWFMTGIDAGVFEVANPYNQRITHVPASPSQVHTIVFWSKDFGPFLDNDYGQTLMQRGYRLFFNFTINSEQPELEPMVPPLKKRLDQLARLVDAYGADAVQWRFDPICYFRTMHGRAGNNLHQFGIIAQRAARLGVQICISSFVDLYRKVERRIKTSGGPELVKPPMALKVETIKRLANVLTGLNIRMQLCCEKDLMAQLPPDARVTAASCIPNDRLIALYGPGISRARDSGQRRGAGCACGVSRDIGSYNLHPCGHNCLFCYANPCLDGAPGQRNGNWRQCRSVP